MGGNCEGAWSQWTPGPSGKMCDNAEALRTFSVSKRASQGGKTCKHKDGDVQKAWSVKFLSLEALSLLRLSLSLSLS